jgi:transcriptional regulator with XRE-family HTH domain
MTVGKAMRRAREKAGLTQNELSAITGVRAASISQYENDVYLPRVDMAEILADSLGISIDEYIGHNVSEDFEPDVEAFKRMQQITRVRAFKEISGKLTSFVNDILKKEMEVDLNDR